MPALLLAALLAGVAVPGARAQGDDRAPAAEAPEAAPLAEAAPAAGEPAADETFDVWEFQVEGNTLLPQVDIERAVYGHLGKGRTFENIDAARQQLEALYRDRGFGTVLVDIPEQDVSTGVVRLAVTQGAVERLRVSGSRYFSLGRIKSRVPALAEGSVPYLPAVQAELAALNRSSADRRITPVLRPGRTPGRLEVDLKVEDKLPLHAAVDLNDRRSADTTRTRLNATLRYDNLWQREHGLSVSYQVSPQDANEVEVVSGTYVARFAGSPNVLALYAVRSNTDVATVGTLGVIGSGTIAGLRYTLPLAGTDRWFHSATAGADYKDFDEDIALQGADSIRSPISYLSLTASYSATLLGDSGTTRFDLGATFAPRGLGNTTKEFDIKRFGATPGFAVFRAGVEHRHKAWFGTQILARLDGQVASAPLVSNEQFGIGGLDSVRGYLESQNLGDDGATATLEWRSPSFAPRLSARLNDLTLFAFSDFGYVRTRDPLPGQDASATLESAGAGVSARAFDGLSASLAWAWPLRDARGVTAAHPRIHFNLGYEF
ncbi:MAG: ShlB/FhaC/HecB family hemolysin secretion/activation protein [Gammaproteobacteria bacterium]